MELIDLDVDVRDKVGSRSSRRLRRMGRVPAVLYGQDREPRSLSLDAKTLDDLLRDEQRMVNLKMGSDSQRAIIKEVQHDVFGDTIIHVDFARIKMGIAMNFTVPITLDGIADGVKKGGVLEQKKDMIEIFCTPEKLPEHIDVSVVEVGLGESLHLGEISLPEGVQLANEGDKDDILLAITVPGGMEEDEEVAEPEAEEGQPEVIKKGKEEEAEGDKS